MQPLGQDAAAAALAWLDERGDGGLTGYDATGWAASAWVVNAMYETDTLPGGMTYDETRRIEQAAGATEPVMFGELDLNELLADATLTGGSLGRSGWPGPGWHRLRWSDLAARLGVDPYAIDVPPCFRSFPMTSWPVNITPPAEGSLDREQFSRLLDHLAEETTDGYDAPCFSYYSPLAAANHDGHIVFRCELRDLMKLYDDEELSGSPSNVWPANESWLVYTDWDFWASKISGPQTLIDRLLQDDDLEVVVLGF